MKKSIIILSILLFIGNCSSNKSSNDADVKSFLLYVLANPSATTTQNACVTAVTVMNTCVAQGYGYNINLMCDTTRTYSASDGTSVAYSEADFNNLKKCVEPITVSTACNLNSFKAPNAQVATSSLFSSCNDGSFVTDPATNSTLPSGIIRTSPFQP